MNLHFAYKMYKEIYLQGYDRRIGIKAPKSFLKNHSDEEIASMIEENIGNQDPLTKIITESLLKMDQPGLGGQIISQIISGQVLNSIKTGKRERVKHSEETIDLVLNPKTGIYEKK